MSDGKTDTPENADQRRVLVLNPVSGTGEHAEQVRALATQRGFEVRETQAAGDAVTFAREAAEADARLVAAAGGDGTLNEVVRGLDEADALDAVTFGVVPTGTGNNFAQNVGITGIEHAFEVIDDGPVRTIDVGTADDGLFLNSCIGGLTADASAETTAEMKNRWGVLAYVISTVRTAAAFDGLELDVRAVGAEESQWSGEALFVLVGNARRFPAEGRTQANMEDGLLDVTIIEQRPTTDLLGETAVRRLLGRETPHIHRMKAPHLQIAARQDEPINFSLDGEMSSHHLLELDIRPRALSLHVGESYRPDPDAQPDDKSKNV